MLFKYVKVISNLKHIVVSKENYLGLKDRGKMGQSFNDVITMLLRENKSTETKTGETHNER